MLFGLLALVHLGIQLLGLDDWSRPTQVLLMPALALVLVAAVRRPRERLLTLAIVALVFSWLGDTAPAFASGDVAFLLMVGFFLVAQVVYVVAFWPYRARSALYRRRALLIPYVGFVAVLVWLCAPHTGRLLVPVLLYGLILGLMAILATGLNPRVAIGGALFLVSDALIALRAFAPGWDLPQGGFWVMSTYIAAQTLIVLGLLAHERNREERTGGTGTGA
ncbi:lysoplasmalogenase [Nocardiopsis metallicus]|uniref:Putative membrane protein YhhN n=1 Tax=Nocardiopsis metallicus TaxID=179819 RepID=A0A840WQE5_9ACTN|nr:lysoplasmalogenase [Nocardiopsis metallicus]MBB5495211.1 putative membrane protein YhhN [Nocardiopsis metallicus]